MATTTKTKRARNLVRKSRALGIPLTPKAEKYFERRPYAPGEHGRARRKQDSDYKVRLMEKQRLRAQYNIREKQMHRAYVEAKRVEGQTGENLIALLETRLDALVLRAGFVRTMAAARQAFVDQSQSLNLFIESPNIGKLSSMYLYAWKAGLKTTYYLRSRPATRIQQATVAGVRAGASWGAATGTPGASQPTAPGSPGVVGGLTASEPVRTFTDEEALACSLENPEACEACE